MRKAERSDFTTAEDSIDVVFQHVESLPREEKQITTFR